MFRRTHREPEARVAIIYDPDLTVLWPALDSLADSGPRQRHLVQIALFDPFESSPRHTLWADISTVESACLSWSRFLRPPLRGRAPRFSAGTIIEVADAGVGCVAAEAESIHEALTAHILCGFRHLDQQAILESVRSGLSIALPDLISEYRIEWEYDAPAGLGNALYEQSRLRRMAHIAELRSEHIAQRAFADDHWLEHVLPMMMRAEETRWIEEPIERSQAREMSWILEESLSAHGKYATPVGRAPTIVRDDNEDDAFHPRPDSLLQRLLHEAHFLRRLPGVSPDDAIQWLTQRTFPRVDYP